MTAGRTRVRSDFALRLLLEKIVGFGISDHVRNLVEDALRHMGGRSPYHGGRTLTDFLRQAHDAARAEHDDDTAERLEDALAYATYVMLAPDMELKYRLLTHQRGRQVPANEVHRAVAQAMNYLVVLDEDRPRPARQGIDARRAAATVIVGHPRFEPEASEAEIDAALRLHNSHLSRVEVVTYQQVVARAARSLKFADPPQARR